MCFGKFDKFITAILTLFAFVASSVISFYPNVKFKYIKTAEANSYQQITEHPFVPYYGRKNILTRSSVHLDDPDYFKPLIKDAENSLARIEKDADYDSIEPAETSRTNNSRKSRRTEANRVSSRQAISQGGQAVSSGRRYQNKNSGMRAENQRIDRDINQRQKENRENSDYSSTGYLKDDQFKDENAPFEDYRDDSQENLLKAIDQGQRVSERLGDRQSDKGKQKNEESKTLLAAGIAMIIAGTALIVAGALLIKAGTAKITLGGLKMIGGYLLIITIIYAVKGAALVVAGKALVAKGKAMVLAGKIMIGAGIGLIVGGILMMIMSAQKKKDAEGHKGRAGKLYEGAEHNQAIRDYINRRNIERIGEREHAAQEADSEIKSSYGRYGVRTKQKVYRKRNKYTEKKNTQREINSINRAK